VAFIQSFSQRSLEDNRGHVQQPRPRPGKQVQLEEREIRALCMKSREIFITQPVLLELEAPIKICGTHCKCFSSKLSFCNCFCPDGADTSSSLPHPEIGCQEVSEGFDHSTEALPKKSSCCYFVLAAGKPPFSHGWHPFVFPALQILGEPNQMLFIVICYHYQL
jgi:hypothetical protein